MNKARLSEIKALLSQLSPGPWRHDGYRVYVARKWDSKYEKHEPTAPGDDECNSSLCVLYEHKHNDYRNDEGSDHTFITQSPEIVAELVAALEEATVTIECPRCEGTGQQPMLLSAGRESSFFGVRCSACAGEGCLTGKRAVDP